MATDPERPPYTPFFGAMGATAAISFSGKLVGTWRCVENQSCDNRKLEYFIEYIIIIRIKHLFLLVILLKLSIKWCLLKKVSVNVSDDSLMKSELHKKWSIFGKFCHFLTHFHTARGLLLLCNTGHLDWCT